MIRISYPHRRMENDIITVGVAMPAAYVDEEGEI